MRIPLLLLLVATGCNARDRDLLSRVFQRTSQKIESVSGGSPGQLTARMRSSSAPIGTVQRVQSRLEWDRYLDGASVEVNSPADGVIRVTGLAPDLAKKQRILDLVRTTTGVNEVIDGLTLPKEE